MYKFISLLSMTIFAVCSFNLFADHLTPEKGTVRAMAYYEKHTKAEDTCGQYNNCLGYGRAKNPIWVKKGNNKIKYKYVVFYTATRRQPTKNNPHVERVIPPSGCSKVSFAVFAC